MGQDGFVWAIGVVEDRFDPEKLGRVRVRWLGYHTEDKEKILTKDLPWAQVMQSVGGSSMAGVGEAPVNLVEGTWVVGFFRDPGSLQDPIVIGTMPGMNTTTAEAGTSSKKWSQNRGLYKTFNQPQSYDEGNKTVPGTETTYKDFEKGFFDPTVDESTVPHPPSELSFGSAKGYAEVPVKYIVFDYTNKDLYPRVLNLSGEDNNVRDIKAVDQDNLKVDANSGGTEVLSETVNSGLWTNIVSESSPLIESSAVPAPSRITHSDLLHMMFKTTRRIVADARLPVQSSWTNLGTAKWPDTMTYSEAGTDKEPFFRIGALATEENPGSKDNLLVDAYNRLAGTDRESFVLTTGYLEDGFWRDSTTQLPSYPYIRDRADNSTSDTRPSALQSSETGQFGQSGEWYRVTHPRVKYVKRKNLTATQAAQAELLYNSGHYGTGIYEMDDDPKDPVGRQDIKWDDVKPDDLVIVQTPDTNALAQGGIPIASLTSTGVKTKAGFFTGATTGTGKNAKPEIAPGDIVQIAGCRGSQELNGRVFEVIDVSGTDALTFSLGSADGGLFSGPGSTKISTAAVSTYINGGVVLVNPHPVLQWKSDVRERQINIGSPDPETGLTSKHWNQPTGDYNAQYPYNHVYESESGHIKEFDDTPGAERIHEYHRAGTYYEVDHAGNKTDYVKGDRYHISLHDDYVYVKGRVVHTYDDEVLIRANDRVDLSAKWKMQIWSGGDLEIHSKRNINMKSDGDINLQADGHINLQGTTLTTDQAQTKAGTRGVFEMSKIRMKAGHLEAEMVGDEGHPDAMGIALQSNIAPIQIKTIAEGKSIFITSAEDIEMFANTDFYRTTWTGKIYDYAFTDYNLTATTGNIEILAAGTDNTATTSGKGSIFITGKRWVDIRACTEDLELWAMKKIDILADSSSDATLTSAGLVSIEAKGHASQATTGDISMPATRYIQTTSNDWSTTTKANFDVKAAASEVGQIRFETSTAASNINLKASGDMMLQSGIMNIYSTTHKETASNIYMNTSSQAAATAAVASVTIPNTPSVATNATVGKPAYIAETMSLLVTDIPNPVAANPPLISKDSHGLALNENNTTGGGGENIRNLEDLLSDMSSGVVTHTFKPSSNVGAQVWSGPKTTETAGDWSGYKDGPQADTYILGPRSLSTIRRFHGWEKDGDIASSAQVTWNCTIDSTKP